MTPRPAGHAQPERLLPVGAVASGHVAADDQREVVGAEIAAELRDVDAFVGEHLLLRCLNLSRALGRPRPRPDLDRIQLPELPGVADQNVGIPIRDGLDDPRPRQRLARDPILAGRRDGLEPELVARLRKGPAAVVAVRARLAGVRGHQQPVGHRQRIAIQAGVVDARRVVGAGRVGMGDVGDGHLVGVGRRRAVDADDLAGGVRRELRRVDADVGAGLGRRFLDLQEVRDRVGVEPGAGVEFQQPRVVVEAAVEVAAQLVPADVVQRLLARAVVVDLPRKELVERVGLDGAGGDARLGEDLGAAVQGRRAGGFAGVVEGAVGVAAAASASAC